AVLPAFLEELFFRGILLDGMKNFGTVAAVFYGAALFSLYHQSPAQTVYQFICGACFALIALRSGSILPTMVSHFINNAAIVILTACGVESFPVFLIFVFAALFIASLAYLLFFDKRAGEPLPSASATITGKDTSATAAGKDAGATRKKADVKGFTLCALIGIVVCMLAWIAALIA
ncbi:MAG: lysostaphin resistance A-like protein, partial [Candidatus Scatosoma sp.]